MVMRTILSRVCWSLLIFLSSTINDDVPLTFAKESPNFLEPPPSSQPRSTNAVQIKKLSFPIQLSDGTNQHIAGFLYFDRQNLKVCHEKRAYSRVGKCLKKRSLRNQTLQVLVHGFTYNHTYWDPPKKKFPNHSYTRFMAKKGYPVLALDLLGTGASSLPDGDVLNVNQSVSSLAQVLATTRALPNPLGHSFNRIVLVGHSVGTLLAVLTAGTNPGITDFLVATGWSFSPHVVPLSPELITTSLATPYIGFPFPVREELFYFTPSAKQSVIRRDNRFLADQFSRGVLVEGLPLLNALALGDLPTIQSLTQIHEVKVPVLVQLGRFDRISPPLMPEVDAQLYRGSPDVRVDILEKMGHSFNLHRNRLDSWRGINRWITQRIVK